MARSVPATVRFSGWPWALIAGTPAIALGIFADGFIPSYAIDFLTLGVAIALIAYERIHPAFIEVGGEAVSFKGHFFWNSPQRLEYRDISRFEYQRFGRNRRDASAWMIVAVLRAPAGGRATLPVFGRKPFVYLKNALAEWQTAHGCLEPTAFANFSDDVRL